LIVFWILYHDPSEDAHLSPVERDYILAGGAVPEGPADSGTALMLGYILTRRKVWGLTLGFACYGYSNSLFASWLPTYFVQTMNVSLLKSASFTMLPWFIATVAQFVIAGWLVDRLVQRGHDETLVRKSTIIACLLGGLAILGAAFTRDVFWVLFWMTISVSALTSASSIGWSFPSLVAPRGGSGIVGAVMNTMNAAVGSISAIVTGAIVDATGSFAVAFVVAAAVLLAGVCFYGLLMGRIEPVPDLPGRGAPRSAVRLAE
jgi:MFS family permease